MTLTAFDTLKRADIPPYELAIAGNGDPVQAPKELVAIFGDSRLKHWAGVSSVAFTPDGKTMVSTGSDNAVRIWDTETGKQRLLLAFPSWAISVAIHPDGKSFAAYDHTNGTVFYDIETGAQTPFRKDFGGTLAWSPSGNVLVAANWNTGATIQLADVASGHIETIGELGYSFIN